MSRARAKEHKPAVAVARLQCLVFAQSESRRRLLRAAAEVQAWNAIVCCDTGEFLKAAFRRRVPLIIVDILPAADALPPDSLLGAQSLGAQCAESWQPAEGPPLPESSSSDSTTTATAEPGLSQRLQETVQSVMNSQDALLAVCSVDSSDTNEIWARSLGAWSYLSEAKLQVGFEFILEQAREAIERREVQAALFADVQSPQ